MTDVHPDRLHQFVMEVIAGLGSDPREQQLVADQLVGANLAGHDSHGVGMLPTYVDRASHGLLKINGHVSVARDDGSIVVLDGNRSFGQVTGFETMEIAIERGNKHGLALVGLRDSFHIGRIGHWAEQAAAAGLISMHFVNVAGHHALVAPHGGRDARFATNPFCVAIPAADNSPSVLLDMATSRIALGKARVANNAGVKVPYGTVIGTDGILTDDPGVMFSSPPGALVAMGEHKGSGLAIVCELLGAALLGGTTLQPKNPDDGSVLNSMTTIVIKPGAVGDPVGLRSEVDSFLDWVRSSGPAEGYDEVLTPGQPEQRARIARATAIPIDSGTFGELIAVSTQVGVDGETLLAVA